MSTSTGIILLPITAIPRSDGSYLRVVNHWKCQGTCSDLSTGARLLQQVAAFLSSGPDLNKSSSACACACAATKQRFSKCSKRVQTHSKRAANTQQARSNRHSMKHVCYIEIHTHRYASAHLYVWSKKTQSQIYRYAMLLLHYPSKMHMCMYLHVCQLNVHYINAHMHFIQFLNFLWANIHTDTVKCMQIQACAYHIYIVHIRYALFCILCRCVCICMSLTRKEGNLRRGKVENC